MGVLATECFKVDLHFMHCLIAIAQFESGLQIDLSKEPLKWRMKIMYLNNSIETYNAI